VRNRGRRLRDGKQSLVDTLLPTLGIENWGLRIKECSNLKSLIPNPLWLEIGFGAGEHLVMQAKLHPEISMIGCEPYINGISKLLQAIYDDKLDNIRIHQGDAREVMDALPDGSIDKTFILFPDPWPKSRHHKRRLINHELFTLLARIMKQNAELLIATDHEDYLTWILEHIQTQHYFEWTAQSKADWEKPPKDWVTTKYQAKALREGRVPHWLRLRLAPLHRRE
jgi:tRNA (guanine-N7-)-methyltransferase